MKYIALLRGINVGGKNKVAMPDLKICFEDAGLSDVTTYINSGNVLFDHKETDNLDLTKKVERIIEDRFGFHVICAIISVNDFMKALEHAPKWWGKGEGKHNAIFVIEPKKTEEIMTEVGDIKPEYEKVEAYHPVIFWSAPLETFSHTRYSKIVGTKMYKSVTIRNFNTVRKLVELTQKA